MLEVFFNKNSGMSHTDGGPTGGDVAGPVVLELGDNDSDNNHAAEHDDGSDNEHRLAANLVNDQL
jgi:hypothetical protein